MKVLSRKIFTVQEPDLKVTFNIYLVNSKQELKGLINKFTILRGLYNGNSLYVWDAGKCDHTYVSGYLSEYEPNFNYRNYIGITMGNEGPYETYIQNSKYLKLIEELKEKYF